MSAAGDNNINQSSTSTNIQELRISNSNFITRSKPFKKLCAYVFKICDADSQGNINATELYAGVLLVHLNLAKYAGPAACFPATRDVVEKLFIASDADKSGGIDEDEFEAIMVITAASISSRILAYYTLLLVLVPYLASKVLLLFDFLRLDDGILEVDAVFDLIVPGWIPKIPDSFWLSLPEKIINLAFFTFVIPKIFDTIDKTGREFAERSNAISRKQE